jgi:hypothetical protein
MVVPSLQLPSTRRAWSRPVRSSRRLLVSWARSSRRRLAWKPPLLAWKLPLLVAWAHYCRLEACPCCLAALVFSTRHLFSHSTRRPASLVG